MRDLMREGWEEWESQNSGINAESTLFVTIPYNLSFAFLLLSSPFYDIQWWAQMVKIPGRDCAKYQRKSKASSQPLGDVM